jgi:hypothetical protein
VNCWKCDDRGEARPALAVCSFCGRAVCKEHSSTMPSFIAMFLGGNSTPKGLAVANVIWCGICEPQPEPIPMPELF